MNQNLFQLQHGLLLEAKWSVFLYYYYNIFFLGLILALSRYGCPMFRLARSGAELACIHVLLARRQSQGCSAHLVALCFHFHVA